MSDSPLRFSPVSPGEWSCIREKAADRGFNLNGDSGQVQQMGVTVGYNYDAEVQTLTFTVVDKPVFIPSSMVETQLRNVIESSGCLAPKP